MPKQWITNKAEMEDILRECAVGSLATVCPDGAPYVVTVNYVYHNGKIYFHSALKGKKIDNISHDPRVCFEAHVVERIIRSPRAAGCSTRYRSVIAHGRARQLTEEKAKLEALTALAAKYADGQLTEPPTGKETATTAVVEIEIAEMTGKKNVDHPL